MEEFHEIPAFEPDLIDFKKKLVCSGSGVLHFIRIE